MYSTIQELTYITNIYNRQSAFLPHLPHFIFMFARQRRGSRLPCLIIATGLIVSRNDFVNRDNVITYISFQVSIYDYLQRDYTHDPSYLEYYFSWLKVICTTYKETLCVYKCNEKRCVFKWLKQNTIHTIHTDEYSGLLCHVDLWSSASKIDSNNIYCQHTTVR
jgi:hypothetical protein